MLPDLVQPDGGHFRLRPVAASANVDARWLEELFIGAPKDKALAASRHSMLGEQFAQASDDRNGARARLRLGRDATGDAVPRRLDMHRASGKINVLPEQRL